MAMGEIAHVPELVIVLPSPCKRHGAGPCHDPIKRTSSPPVCSCPDDDVGGRKVVKGIRSAAQANPRFSSFAGIGGLAGSVGLFR